jgi:hypothetical protein
MSLEPPDSPADRRCMEFQILGGTREFFRGGWRIPVILRSSLPGHLAQTPKAPSRGLWIVQHDNIAVA